MKLTACLWSPERDDLVFFNCGILKGYEEKTTMNGGIPDFYTDK